MIRLERLKELRGLKAFEDIKKAIENEGFLSNLFDGNIGNNVMTIQAVSTTGVYQTFSEDCLPNQVSRPPQQ